MNPRFIRGIKLATEIAFHVIVFIVLGYFIGILLGGVAIPLAMVLAGFLGLALGVYRISREYRG